MVTATGVSYSGTLEEGTHTVQLTVKDTAGNTATSTWTFSVKLPPDYTLYYILAAVVVVIIVAAVLLLRKK
jgi:ABC-type antimicrobial peptide transport system permease subunit